MLSRCYNANDSSYKFYGMKGVTVCERWFRFDYFIEDIKKIEGFSEKKFFNGELELDKDIKQFNSNTKEYNVLNCSFVSKLNNIQYRKFSIQKEFIAKNINGEIHYHSNIRELEELKDDGYYFSASFIEWTNEEDSEGDDAWLARHIPEEYIKEIYNGGE